MLKVNYFVMIKFQLNKKDILEFLLQLLTISVAVVCHCWNHSHIITYLQVNIYKSSLMNKGNDNSLSWDFRKQSKYYISEVSKLVLRKLPKSW